VRLISEAIFESINHHLTYQDSHQESLETS
jgi:hypothetical protein